MEKHIIGRDQEKKILSQMLASHSPELLAIYGRRRVGKSFLVTEFFEEKAVFFEAIGAKYESKKAQLRRFLREIDQVFGGAGEDSIDNDWDGAFDLLVSKVNQTIEKNPDRKIVLFFDEIPWLDSKRSKFLSALEYVWNKNFCKQRYQNVKIVICGSSASWMIKKVITNKAGLHNRLTAIIRLQPFSLQEVELFLQAKEIYFDRKQIVDLYMIFGGIPKYLDQIKRGQSIGEIVEHLLLNKDGYLYNEFDELYSSLFDDYKFHMDVIRELSQKMIGLSQSELINAGQLSGGGHAVSILRELEESGFIMSIPLHGNKKKGKLYRLVDEYSLFYLKWIADKKIPKSSWAHRMNSQAYHIWSGYQYENLCFKHLYQIKSKLGIQGVFTEFSCWYDHTAQIDLLIERADKAIHLCEIKYYEDKIADPKSIAESFIKKARSFKAATQTKSLLIKTLISTYGLVTNSDKIDKNIVLDDLFIT
ncbi:MAG: AAA family ATPase [Oligoflexia bacterium]|nr:AAA family ATPase [Oligoflexia bacterium]